MSFLRFLWFFISGRGGPQLPMPARIRLSRAKGWRMPANCVKVDRSTRWGNPFRAGPQLSPEAVTREYEEWILGETAILEEDKQLMPPTLEEIRFHLRGKSLGCWCPLGSPCHAEILLRLANDA
jgi:hypothetical protein